MGVSSEKHDSSARNHSIDDDVKNGIIQDGKADAALDFLRAEDTHDVTEVNEKALVRKIDWMIMPLMWAAYNLQYLDKVLSRYSRASARASTTHSNAFLKSQLCLCHGVT